MGDICPDFCSFDTWILKCIKISLDLEQHMRCCFDLSWSRNLKCISTLFKKWRDFSQIQSDRCAPIVVAAYANYYWLMMLVVYCWTFCIQKFAIDYYFVQKVSRGFIQMKINRCAPFVVSSICRLIFSWLFCFVCLSWSLVWCFWQLLSFVCYLFYFICLLDLCLNLCLWYKTFYCCLWDFIICSWIFVSVI